MESGLRPESLRYGVWQTPVSAVFPSRDNWSLLGSGRSVRRAVRRAIKAAGIAHIVIDANQLTTQTTTRLRDVDRLLAHVQWQRDRARLQVVTMGELTAKLTRKREVVPAQSILRAA